MTSSLRFHRHSAPPPIKVSVSNLNPREDDEELCLSPGYRSYSQKLLLSLPTEYDTASNDDLSADETYDTATKSSNWRKVRNVVQWTPFIQTYKRHKYPWVQLAGHQGNFKAGHKPGSIMKKLCAAEEKAFETLQQDVLQSFVPEFLGTIDGSDGDKYLQLQDLLSDFTSPCVMDIKMGVRTYLEDELAKARHKPKLRKDMYEKMIQIDLKAPTEKENRAKAVTKPRYMVWRETISSTATLGFRIEGVRRGDGTSSKDFKTIRTRDQVLTALHSFIDGYSETMVKYIERLKAIKSALENSVFFNTHELIGSSLLFVHNEDKSGIWLIDFAKTVPLPSSVKITHRVPWVEGTHEDGYLIGLDNLIGIFENLYANPTPVQKGQANEAPANSSQDSNAKPRLDATIDEPEVVTRRALTQQVRKTQSHPVGSHVSKNVADVIQRKCLNSQSTEKKAN